MNFSIPNIPKSAYGFSNFPKLLSKYMHTNDLRFFLQTTIKVYANCLRPDIEYKTLCISYETTCREIVQNLLNKYRMRHRDPKLYYLTMEVTVRRPNVRTVLPLDEDARPAVLQSCHPRGDSRYDSGHPFSIYSFKLTFPSVSVGYVT